MDAVAKEGFLKLKLRAPDFVKAEEFADLRTKGSEKLYRWRGEQNSEKIRQDIIIGALGEIAVSRYLRKLGCKCSKPDFSIYEANKKSFEPDLVCDDKLLHVKSQGMESVKRYGSSWLMQKKDKLFTECSDLEYFAFTNVNVEAKTVELLGLVKVLDIVKLGCLGEPKVPSYRHTKIALYFDQIQEKCPIFLEF